MNDPLLLGTPKLLGGGGGYVSPLSGGGGGGGGGGRGANRQCYTPLAHNNKSEFNNTSFKIQLHPIFSSV